MTVRPLYAPQLPQRRWGSLGSPHPAQVEMVGLQRASWERRILVRRWECLLFGNAITVPPVESLR